MPLPPVSRIEAERIISASRLALAGALVFAVWMDPASPARWVNVTYLLHVLYAAYALTLLAIAWLWRGSPKLALSTQIVDIASFSLLQYITMAPSSPLFIYFVFAMFCGALRWGWKGTLATTGVVMAAYVGLVITSPSTATADFQLNRIIVRIVYMLMAGAMLVYLGRYEERLRDEIERLARWPATAGSTVERATHAIVEHAARIVGAGRAVIVWESSEEPRLHVASWSAAGLTLIERPPGGLATLLPDALADRILLIGGEIASGSPVVISDADGVPIERSTRPLPAPFFEFVTGNGLASAPFHTERLSGRAFFTDLYTRSGELAALTAVVTREIGTWLDQLYVTRQLQEIATREERLRLARDLHDGVLQSLTGIRFELRAVANTLQDTDQEIRARLFALERALSIEQRELRFFIGGLKPGVSGMPPSASLAGRLDALRERLALEWNTPVSIRVSPESQECPTDLAQAIPLMVHEAVVNALKHAQPTRVNVNVDGATDRLRIVVSDDGHGFPFKGTYDHRALDESRSAPRSLFDRVTALGGKMSIESSDAGSRVEMVVSL